ncbi:hypothetical protein ACQ4N7_15210 [Nodosilinea sp. AN01ver1]
MGASTRFKGSLLGRSLFGLAGVSSSLRSPLGLAPESHVCLAIGQ